MTTYAHADLQTILAAHRQWIYGQAGGTRANLTDANLTDANLRGANLRGANLRGANLTDANLTDANLTSADLADANLTSADLAGANLTRADLAGANLTDANLTSADLAGANLTDANLRGADLTRAVLSDGVTWSEYLSDVVPALLVAGGRSLAEVATPEVWACHSWDNCPMRAAFGVSTTSDVPPLYRWQAARFVQIYDAGLIKLEDVLRPAPRTDAP